MHRFILLAVMMASSLNCVAEELSQWKKIDASLYDSIVEGFRIASVVREYDEHGAKAEIYYLQGKLAARKCTELHSRDESKNKNITELSCSELTKPLPLINISKP